MTAQRLDVVRQEFPEYERVKVFEAAITVYRLRIKAKVMERHRLSVIARFMLRTIAAGASTIEQIAHLLGLEDSDLSTAGAELLLSDLIAHSEPDAEGRRALAITEKGHLFLQEEKKLNVPRQKTLKVLFDPMTREVLPDVGVTLNGELVRKEGVYVIPARGAAPTLGDLDLHRVREVADEGDGGGDDFEVVSLLKLEQPQPAFVRGIRVHELRHCTSGEVRYAAFQGTIHRASISRVIQQRFESGETVVPDEYQDVDADVAAEVGQLLQSDDAARIWEFSESAREIEDLRQNLESEQRTYSATLDRQERAAREEHIRELEQRLKEAEEKNSWLEATLSRGQLTILRTEDHRPLLEQALATAKMEILIISPWMRLDTVTDDFCKLAWQALERGVRIRVGYGLGLDKRGFEAERNRAAANAVIDKLRGPLKGTARSLLEFVNLRNTHE
jgi:hypothetical protein